MNKTNINNVFIYYIVADQYALYGQLLISNNKWQQKLYNQHQCISLIQMYKLRILSLYFKIFECLLNKIYTLTGSMDIILHYVHLIE